MLTETGHRVDPQLAGGARLGVAGFRFGLVDIREDLLAALQIALARFGQRDAASRAIQLTGAKVCFEVRNRARRMRCGRIQMLRSTREAARFDDTHECTHVLESIHFPFLPNSTGLLHISGARLIRIR
jgi:hypothetical protein